MFKKVHWHTTIIWGLIGAIAFCIPVYLYIRDDTYTESWLLYVGSALFMIAMGIHIVSENKKRGENESTVALMFISQVATIIGIIAACLISFILLVLFVPGYLESGNTAKQLTDTPPSTISDKTNGLSLKIFATAIIANFCAGSFVGIVFPFSQKRNQTRDSEEPTPFTLKRDVKEIEKKESKL